MTAPRLRWRWLEWLVDVSIVVFVVAVGVIVARSIAAATVIDVCQSTTAAFDQSCPAAGTSSGVRPTLTVTENVTLGSPHEGPIEIAADGVTLDCAGHRVHGAGRVGIYVSGRSGVTIKSCAVSGFDVGIRLDRSTSSVVADNVAEANGTGYSLVGANDNQLIGNAANLNRLGFQIEDSHDNVLDANTTLLGVVGVTLADANNNTLQANEIVDVRGLGIEVENAVGTIINGNQLSSRLYGGTTAVRLNGVNGGVVSDNSVSAGRLGFSLRGVTDSTFEANEVTGAPWGFEIVNAHGNTFIANEMVDADTPMWGLAMSVDNVFADNLGIDLSAPVRLDADHTLEADHVGRFVIAADDITLDCDGHGISAPRWGPGAPVNRIEAAIEVSHHKGVTIENCDIAGYQHGIVLWQADGNTIRNNTGAVKVIKSDRNQVIDNQAAGIKIKRSHRNTITGCTVTEGGDIVLLNARNNTVEGNTLGHRSNLRLTRTSGSSVAANTITGGRLLVRASTDNTIAGNTVTLDQDAGVAAAFFVGEGATKNVIADNVVRNGRSGFYLNKSSNNTYRNNVTAASKVGFRLDDSFGNTFESNDASGSDEPIAIKGTDDNTYIDNIGF